MFDEEPIYFHVKRWPSHMVRAYDRITGRVIHVFVTSDALRRACSWRPGNDGLCASFFLVYDCIISRETP